MNTINCISCWGEPSGSYNPSTVNNGGGYWQFDGGMLAAIDDGRQVVVEVEDSSCGDFGTRRYYTVTVQSETEALVWRLSMGTMDDASLCSREESAAIVAAIGEELGISSFDVKQLLYTALDEASEAAWDKWAAEEDINGDV